VDDAAVVKPSPGAACRGRPVVESVERYRRRFGRSSMRRRQQIVFLIIAIIVIITMILPAVPLSPGGP